MAFIPDASVVELSDFSGAWVPSSKALDAVKIPIDKGRLAQNVSFFGSNVGTRLGYSTVFSPAAIVRAMANWLFLNSTTPANYIAFYVPGVGVRIANLASPTASTLIAETTGYTAFMTPNGARMYAAFMDVNGIGVAAPKVCAFGGSAEPLFAPPITPTITLTEPFAGSVTLGAKNYGYLLVTTNGFITRPSPASDSPTSATFAPVSFTSAGGKIVQFVVNPGGPWPTYSQYLLPIMTTTANPNQYFIVPNSQNRYTITGSSTVTIALDVTDDYLTTNGIDATPYLNELSQSVAGGAPINPWVISTYGQRMVYHTLDAAGVPVTYFSDSSQPQTLNAASSGVYLPGNLMNTTGFALRGTYYILGPHWTYATSDSNGVPATWAQPQLVDGSIGAIGPFCVSLNSTQNSAWVADEAGLYLFQGGSYPARPVSYWQSADWQRINFAATTQIQVVDHKSDQRVIVLAPLDGATSPTHMLTFDYSLGTEPETIQYSINNLSGYSMGAIAMIQNNTTKHVEPWLGPSSASYGIIRENNGTETHAFRDVAAAINSVYEYAPLPRGAQGNVVMHHGVQMRVRGNGTLLFTLFSLDQGTSMGPFNIPLNQAPDAEFLQRLFMRSEYASGRFQTNAVDEWFNLSRVDHYYTLGSPMR